MKTEIFDDLVNFLVDKLPAEEVISFRPSAGAQKRFDELADAVKSGVATPDEQREMEQNIQLEHMMQLAKARARAKVAAQSQAVSSGR